MTTIGGNSPVKRVQIEATIIRADGTVEKLGTISDSSWRWRFTPLRLISRWRIHKANGRVTV
jgi:hypothetical protein